ncbi:MAG: Xaa-Pro peptidase family protein [Minisyncoccales bacterium]
MDDRIKILQKFIATQNLGGMIITNPANIFYLTGVNNFDSEKGFLMMVCKNKWRLISSLFYQNRIQGVIPNENAIYVPRGGSISEYLSKRFVAKEAIGFEREDLSFARYEIFKKALRGKKLIPVSDAIEQMRQIKNADEIALIKKAAAITDKTFAELLKLIKPGVAEIYLKQKTIEIMNGFGATGIAFDPIVASGKNSADPHYEGSNKKIKAGELVVIDIGARYKNYDADMTRMVFVGKAPAKYKNLYSLVLQTQQKAIAECKAGALPVQIFENAVNNFAAAGEDEFFTHGLGHGVGIDIHELPNLSPKGQGILENNMVFTVEPGLYHPGWGGIRIEDLCRMKNGKAEILSRTPKNLIEIQVK